MRACVRAAASSMRRLGNPPDRLRHAAHRLDLVDMRLRARGEICGEPLDIIGPAPGIDDPVDPLSSIRNNCVLRAMRAENGVGSASASSSALVCSDCVCPCVAAIASICVRTMLLKGSCAVSDQPDVWLCVRSGSDFSDFGLNA